MERLEAIIFDFDGTLVDSAGRQHRWFKYWAAENGKELAYAGEKLDSFEKFIKVYNKILRSESIQKLYGKLGLPCDINDLNHPVWPAHRKYQAEHPLGLYSGMKEVLEWLRNMNLKLAINSSNSIKPIENELKDVLNYFNPIITAEYLANYHGAKKSSAIQKPSKISIALMLNELDVEGSRTMHVGDTLNDLVCCKGVMRQRPTRFEDLKAVGVSWGFEGREELEKGVETSEGIIIHFDRIIDKPQELVEIVKKYL